jgi:phosphatidylethanolamine-binding protein
MLTASVLAVLSTVFVVNAQSSNPQLEVESIRAQFENAYLVPDLIPSFNPIAYLTVKFAAGDIAAGTPLTVAGKS